MSENTIPKAALSPLEDAPWHHDQVHSVFDRNYKGKRVGDPSGYNHRHDGDAGVSAFTTAEVLAMKDAGILDGLISEHSEHVWVNEHAEHALIDFYSDVHRAYALLLRRLAAAAERVPVDTVQIDEDGEE